MGGTSTPSRRLSLLLVHLAVDFGRVYDCCLSDECATVALLPTRPVLADNKTHRGLTYDPNWKCVPPALDGFLIISPFILRPLH